MPVVERSALVPWSAAQMYDLVKDVERYPEFLPWCASARVRSETETEQIAELELRGAGLSQRFSTRNRLDPPGSIRLQLMEGPFSTLQGEWRFQQLGDAGCKVELTLSFQPTGRLMKYALGAVWKAAADRMVDAFSARARTIYG